MTTNWKGGSGNWQTAANWTAGAPTTPSAFAVINAAGTYIVTIGTGLEYHVGAVSLNAAGAKLAIAGILDLTNKLTVSKGTLAVSGTIRGGTIASAGGTIKFQNATLDKVTYDGALDLVANTAQITVENGLILRGANGRGAGAVTLGGSSQISFAGDQTLNGGTLTIAGGKILQTGKLIIGAAQKVQYKSPTDTFAVDASIVNRGSVNIGRGALLSTGQVVNPGKMTVNGGGIFDTVNFTNTSTGYVDVVSGSVFRADSFDNSGSVGINSGSVFQSGSFDNSGTFSADSATVSLTEASGGSFGNLAITNSTVALGIIKSVAELDALETMLAGHANNVTADISLNNTGDAITLGMPSGFKAFSYSTDITGGTVSIDAPFSGDLTALAYQGTANVVGALQIAGVTFAGAGGTGNATMNLKGRLTVAYFDSGSLLDDITVVAAPHSSIICGPQFTLGSNATIRAEGAFELVPQSPRRGQLMTNNGVMEADGGPGTAFEISPPTFRRGDFMAIVNNGTIRVENGGELVAPRLRNAAFHTLTGGTYDIGAHSELVRGQSLFAITTLQATVIYEGIGATFMKAGLATIGADGSLSLENGATLSVASTFTIDGELHLASSPFSSADITIDSGGKLDGYGRVLGAVANSGTIDASGNALSISQDVTGTGQAEIENGAKLTFGSDVSTGQTVTFEGSTGSLRLGNAGGFDGTIAGFAQGDTIDLVNTKAGGVVYHAANDTLSVKFQGKVIATLQLSGDYTGDTFGVASDGNGGTALTLTGVAPGALQRFTEARATFSSSDMATMSSAQASTAWDSAHLLAAGHG